MEIRFTIVQNPNGAYGILDWLNLVVIDGWYGLKDDAEYLASNLNNREHLDLSLFRPPTSYWLTGALRRTRLSELQPFIWNLKANNGEQKKEIVDNEIWTNT
jgi:hypothetical protein